jgi:ATP-dependent DNA ligase
VQPIRPMLATPSTGSANRRPIRLTDLVGRDYIAQEKVDGIRAVLSTSEGGSPRIWNRNGTEITERFPELANIKLPPVTLDGEVVANDGLFSTVATRDKQTRNFDAAARANRCHFVAFDLLRSGDQDVMHLPLHSRLAAMRGIVGSRRRLVRPVRQSEDLLDLWASMVDLGREGIIVKQRKSLYLPGQRASSWIKFKTVRRITAIAIGYEPGENRDFGAMRLALLDGPKPVDIGRVGTGWTLKQQDALKVRLDAGEIFPVEIEALNRTSGNALRFPVFRGERTDVGLDAASADQLLALPVY